MIHSEQHRTTPKGSGPNLFPGALARSVPVRVALLGLLATIAYGGALAAGVAWDDAAVLSANPAIRSLARPWRFFLDPWTINPSGGAMLSQYRPLRTLGFALQFAVFGGNAWGYHLVSLLLHGACAWAVGRFTGRLFGRGGWLAAAIWLLHPALAENALYLAAQGNLLCLLAAVVAVTQHVQWLEAGRLRDRVVCLIAALLSMLAYEFGVTLVALLPLVDVVWRARGRTPRSSWWRRHLPVVLVAAGFLAARAAVVAPLPASAWWGGSWVASAGLQLRFWVEGWRLTLLPISQLVRYEVADAPAWAPLGVAVLVHLVLAGLVIAALRRKASPILAAALVWWYVAQAPTANLLTPNLGYPFAPRFLFLALVLPVAAASAWFAARAERWPVLWWAATLVVLAFIPVDRGRTQVWHDWRTLFASMVEHRADDLTAHLNLADAYRLGEAEVGAAHLEIARRLDPGHAPTVYMLGEVQLRLGHPERAEELFAETLRLYPRHLWARLRLAELALGRGDRDTVRLALAPIGELKSWPPYARARAETSVAELALRLDDCTAARRRAESAASGWPYSGEILARAGTVLLRCGQREAGLELRRRAADVGREEILATVGDAAWLDY